MGGEIGRKGEEDGEEVGLRVIIFFCGCLFSYTLRLLYWYSYISLWEREFLYAFRWLFKQR